MAETFKALLVKRGPNTVPYGPRGDFLARFWNKVEITPTCWNWLGKLSRKGYGYLTCRKSQNVAVHRLSYELHTKLRVPDDKVTDHLCRNRRCVNPVHLEVVTPGENTLRGQSIGAINNRKKLCLNGHEFKNWISPTSLVRRRVCLVCARVRSAEYRKNHPELCRTRGLAEYYKRKLNGKFKRHKRA